VAVQVGRRHGDVGRKFGGGDHGRQ
jgi:hypothetical protein